MLTEKQLYNLFGYYERERFLLVGDVRNARCVHLEPTDDVWPPPESVSIHETYVDLLPVAGPNKTILSYAGKCSVCSKVYYT